MKTPLSSGPGGNDPIRTAFVITSMPVGGAETLLVNLCRRFDKQIVAPEIVCLKEPGPLGERIADQIPLHSEFTRGKFDPLVATRLAQHFRRRSIDVVITVGAGDKMFWGRLAAKWAGVAGVASALHSTGWPDGVGRMNHALTPITDAFIAVADSHAAFLREFEKFPAQRVRTIRNGVDCKRFRPDPDARVNLRRELNLPANAKVVGIVAALRDEKNHPMFVESAATVCRRRDVVHPDQTHFVIVGDGPMRGTIETAIERFGLTGRVHMLGSRNDTPMIVAGLDVFALSSLNEASPVSILEALASGVPVVATDVGSIAEMVIPGQTGTLVPSGDVAAMSDAITDLIDDDAMRNAMGREGRTRVLRHGSLDSMTAGYTELICELAGRPRNIGDDGGRDAVKPSAVSASATIPIPSTLPGPTTAPCESNSY